jgi:hypothetical protein
VFRRAGTFNSADDSIVRSSARQLRTKLHEYFEGPGRDEPVIIEIPKGSYAPEFPSRQVSPVLSAPPVLKRAQPWKRIAICCAAGVVVLAGVLVVSLTRPVGLAATNAQPNLVTWLFGGHAEEVNIVLCDSALVVVNAYRAHMLGLDEYIQQLDQQPLPLPGGNSAGATPPRVSREALDHQFPGHGVCFPAERAERSGGFRSPIETQPPDAGPRLSVRQSHRVG